MNQATPRHVHVGAPPNDFQGWEHTEVHFHNFEDLPSVMGEETSSSEFTCLGNTWQIDIHPQSGVSGIDTIRSGIFLTNRSDVCISTYFGLIVSDGSGKEVWSYFDKKEFISVSDWSGDSRIRRSELLGALFQGTLTVRLQMKLIYPEMKPPGVTYYVPENPFTKNFLNKRFMEKDTSDVIFEVCNECDVKPDADDSKGEEGERKAKRAKASKPTTTNIFAHRFVLECASNELSDMLAEPDNASVVQITDVKPDIFQKMIYYLYGGKISDEYLEPNAQSFVDAADKYGVVGLKLEAEAAYVKFTTLTVDNILDNMLYAYSKNLALLKEAVMDYIVKNKQNIIGKVSFDNAPGSIATDILVAMARAETPSDGESNSSDAVNYNKMRVGTLRSMLNEKGLDVDGSREAMIALLEQNA